MTDDDMAAALRAKGWLVEPPWTKENCKHPPLMRSGQGQLASDGSGRMNWHCHLCGKSDSYSLPPDREMQKRIQLMGMNG